MRSTATTRAEFLFGLCAAITILAAAAEIFLRTFTPAELGAFAAPAHTRGPFVPAAGLGVAYRSATDVYAENAADLAAWMDEARRAGARPMWLFIGNSFVHGAGMLAEHVRAEVPERCVVTLHRSDPLPVRLAQVDVLRGHEPPPERIFLALSTVDLIGLGEQPLATLRVTSGGALTYAPHLPPEPAASLVRQSRLAAAAWLRTGRDRGNPRFDKRWLDTDLGSQLRADLQTLFAHLARRNGGAVPVTIILIPSYQQLTHDAATGFQDQMRALLNPLGYDVIDPLPRLRQHPDPSALFLPDKHFTPLANQILVAAIVEHLGRQFE